jgi:hypothetical protein
MYPADAIQRAAFDLCQSSDSNFVRLRETDRAACLDRMRGGLQSAIGQAQSGAARRN